MPMLYVQTPKEVLTVRVFVDIKVMASSAQVRTFTKIMTIYAYDYKRHGQNLHALRFTIQKNHTRNLGQTITAALKKRLLE